MKLYTPKFTLALIFLYALFAFVIIFFYTTVSQGYLESRARENIQTINDAVATRLESQLLFDYQRFAQTIETYELSALDPYTELKANIDTLLIGMGNYAFFGYIDDDGIVIDDVSYTFRPNFTADIYNQPVTFYQIQEAITVAAPDNVNYMVFNHNGILGFVPALDYMLPLVDDASSIESDHFIMGADNLIFFQDPEESVDKFYDLLRASDVEEIHIDNMKDGIIEGSTFVYLTAIYGKEVFAAFTPLSDDLSTQSLYLVKTYDRDATLASFSVFNYTLWAVFGVTFVLFVVSLFWLHRITASQMIEAEGSRLLHYYDKPLILKISRKGHIVYANKKYKQLITSYKDYKHVRDFKMTLKRPIDDYADFLQKQHAFTAIFPINGKDRYIHFVNVKAKGGYLLCGDDLTDVTGRAEALFELAMIDPITKIPNKNQLLQDLDVVFAPGEGQKRYSIAAFDVISFSKINLLMNEKLGEQMLIMIKDVALESISKYEANLYHISTEQFVIFFKDLPDYKYANQWANAFIERMNNPIQIDRSILEIEVKIGLFHIEKDRYADMNEKDVFENVMLALNHAKKSASSQLIVYDIGLSHFASREELMEKDLAKAIVENEFEMHLQPQFNNLENKIVGFEALIRWKNPKYAKESPQKFIELAEHNNMIIEIGRIALHETLTIAKEMEDYDIDISINVSPVQLLQAGFVSDVIAIFEQYDLKKGSISLEITETFLMSSFDLVIQKLNALKKYGFDIHLDDFGSGYSSLQYLRDLPVSTIKIDRAFVKNMHLDRHSRAIVTMISSLAKNVGLEVVAEGVENEKENQALIRAGCNVIQGYWISPPVPKDQAIELLKKYNGKDSGTRKLRG